RHHDTVAAGRLPFNLTLSAFPYAATTELYPLSLHDALPISVALGQGAGDAGGRLAVGGGRGAGHAARARAQRSAHAVDHTRLGRSEEHTSELQSRFDLVCRLLLEKKKRLRATRAARNRGSIV